MNMDVIDEAVGDRLWLRVDVRGPDECWNWEGARDDDGYGQIKVSGKMQKAHRVAYAVACGAIPDGLCVLHTCDVPSCTNPRHLFLGTSVDNNADMTAKGRRARGEAIGNAKLSEADVCEILSLGGRLSSYKIASRFGVTHRTVWAILRGHAWAHLQEKAS